MGYKAQHASSFDVISFAAIKTIHHALDYNCVSQYLAALTQQHQPAHICSEQNYQRAYLVIVMAYTTRKSTQQQFSKLPQFPGTTAGSYLPAALPSAPS